MRLICGLIFLFSSFTAIAQSKFAILLSKRSVAMQIHHQLKNKSGDSMFVDIPLPKILKGSDSSKVYFIDIISSEKIDYSNYNKIFNTAKSIRELAGLALENGFSKSFLSIRGYAHFTEDSISIYTDSVLNFNFKANDYEQTLHKDRKLFSFPINSVRTDFNGQSIEASLKSQTMGAKTVIATKQFDYRSVANLNDSCLFYLESLPQEGFALLVDTAFVRSHILKNTTYEKLVIDHPFIKYMTDSLILSFEVSGEYGKVQLRNKYKVELTLDAILLKIKSLVISAPGREGSTELGIVKLFANKWLMNNKGKTLKFNNALQNVPIRSGGRDYNLKVDIMYGFYQSGNLILLCSIFQ